MDKFAFIMFLIWILIIIGAFTAHIYYGVPCL